MLKYRLITGPILIAALLGIIVLDGWLETVELRGFWRDLFLDKRHPPPGLALFVLAVIVAPIAALELASVVDANGTRASRRLTILAALTGLGVSYCVPLETTTVDAIAIVSTGLIVVFVLSLMHFSRQQTVEGVLAAAGGVVFAMVYLGLMMGFLLALRRDHSAWIVVGVIMTTKACDSGAYFTGKSIGRHKMIPWLSPGKTWEGLAGGVVTSVVVGAGLAWASAVLPAGQQVPIWLGALCGFVFAFVGQFGDLTMSLFKRGGGLKDSSTILPGLGGVLDVLDSPLMVAPVAFWMLTRLG